MHIVLHIPLIRNIGTVALFQTPIR